MTRPVKALAGIDDEGGIVFFDVDGFGVAVAGQPCGELIGRVEQPGVAGFGRQQYKLTNSDDAPMAVSSPALDVADLVGEATGAERNAQFELSLTMLAQFRDKFNRPDIVALVLTTLDVDEAVRKANAASGRKAAIPVAKGLPPVVKIVSPPDLSLAAKSPIARSGRFRSTSIRI